MKNNVGLRRISFFSEIRCPRSVTPFYAQTPPLPPKKKIHHGAAPIGLWNSNVLCFSKKVRFCMVSCVLICVDTVKLWRCCYRWLGIWPLRQRHDLIQMCFLSYFKQWPSDLPMESYIYFLLIYKYEKNIFFSKINAYLNILNQ